MSSNLLILNVFSIWMGWLVLLERQERAVDNLLLVDAPFSRFALYYRDDNNPYFPLRSRVSYILNCVCLTYKLRRRFDT